MMETYPGLKVVPVSRNRAVAYRTATVRTGPTLSHGSCNSGTCVPSVALGPECCGQRFFPPLKSQSDFQNWAVIADSNEEDAVKWTLQVNFS